MSEKLAILTIDDCPSIDFERKLDILIAKKIPAIFFCQGNLLENNTTPIEKAIKNGYPIGNHAYHHRHFSDLPIDECFDEIEKTDKLIASIYQSCGVYNYKKFFRFPYGDVGDLKYGFNLNSFEKAYLRRQSGKKKVGYKFQKGLFKSKYISKVNWLQKEGEYRKEKIQAFLREQHYSQPDLKMINYAFFEKFKVAYDWSWTLDLMEWKLLNERSEKADFSQLLKRINSDNPNDERGLIKESYGLNNKASGEIILLHDHVQTGVFFFKIIDFLEKMNVKFVHPEEVISEDKVTGVSG